MRDGDRTAALLNAVASNRKNSLLRTNADKQLAVRLLLQACPDWTDRKAADHCGVSHLMVAEVRSAIAAAEAVSEEGDSTVATDATVESPAATVASVATATKDKKGRRNTGGSGTKRKKADHAKAAAKLLKADPSRSNEDIATELECHRDTVAIARKELERLGYIKPQPKPDKSKTPASSPSSSTPSPAGAGSSRGARVARDYSLAAYRSRQYPCTLG